MKKLSILVSSLFIMVFTSCNSVDGNKTETTTNEIKAGVVNQINTELFKKLVYDYQKNPNTWVFEGNQPVIIDFYADWCKPCKIIAPIMEELAEKYDGKVKIYKIDTQKEKELASIFQIRSIPAVLFSPLKGKPMMQAGALPKDMYIKIIEENILNPVEIK